MKQHINHKVTLFLAALLLCAAGCRRESIPMYRQNPGVFFSQNAYSFSFAYDQTVTSKEIRLAVSITGFTADHDRRFTIAHPAVDTLTTADPDQYEVGEGIVPAGSTDGYATVTVKYDPRLDARIDTLLFEILPSEDFPEVRLNRSFASVAFTKMVIQPENWNWLRYYFGTAYSTRWYLFILDVTGTELPYNPFHADKETWWMSANELEAYQSKVRLALEKYNREHQDAPLTHDDGEYAGTVVTMP